MKTATAATTYTPEQVYARIVTFKALNQAHKEVKPDDYSPTPSKRRAFDQQGHAFRSILTALTNGVQEQEEIAAQQRDLIKDRATLDAARKYFCTELLHVHRKIHDPRRAQDRVILLKISITAIDRGAVSHGNLGPAIGAPLADYLREHGTEWDRLYGCLPQIERRLIELEQRLAAVHARIHDAMQFGVPELVTLG